MHDLDQILIVLGCGCVLPIMVVWFVIRESMNKTNQRTQIVLAAIEKNPDMDIEELMKKISPKKKLLKEKLLSKLQTGSITALLGVGFLVCALYVDYLGGMSSKDLRMLYLVGAILSGVGVAVIIKTSGLLPFASALAFCKTPNLCCSSIITRFKFLNLTLSCITECVPTIMFVVPFSIAGNISFCFFLVFKVDDVTSSIFIFRPLSIFVNVR